MKNDAEKLARHRTLIPILYVHNPLCKPKDVNMAYGKIVLPPSGKKEVRSCEPLPKDDIVENRKRFSKGISLSADSDQPIRLDRTGD